MNEFQNLVRRLFTKLMGMSMFNRWIVLIVDLAVCAVTYVLSVYIRSRFDHNHGIPNPVLWGLLYLGLNAGSFFIFKSYRGLIRHSNLQELWRVFVVNSIQKCSDYGIWTCSEIGNKSAVFLASRVQ
jgi:FlaA1/EpsC-like NDP-sugar epimerase